MEIPQALLEFIRAKRCVVISGGSLGVDSGLPDSANLKEILADAIQQQIHGYDPSSRNLYDVAQDLAEYRGQKILAELLSEAFSGVEPDTIHRQIARHFQYIATGGLDSLYEQSLEAEGISYQLIYSEKTASLLNPSTCNLIKMHGLLENPESIIYTTRSIERYEKTHPRLREVFKRLIRENAMVFFGYSLNDDTLKHLYTEVEEMMTGSITQPRYVIDPADVGLRRILLASYGFRILNATTEDFLDALEKQL